MFGFVADVIVDHTAVVVFILIFHIQTKRENHVEIRDFDDGEYIASIIPV